MAIQTNIEIRINGEAITTFSRMGIQQGLLSHHSFFVKQPLPKAFIAGVVNKAQKYIGQEIHIEIRPKHIKDAGTGLIFKGLVTDVDVDRSRGAAGEIVISGISPTAKMDGVYNTRSHLQKEFSAVVWDTIGSHKESMDLQLQIHRDELLDYTVQYKESDFGFLCRMARKKGEWFYYNGTGLVFGKPQSRSFSLVYGQNITHFKRHMSIKPLGFQYTGYDAEAAETQTTGSGEVSVDSIGLTRAMLETSKRVFPDNGAALYYHHPITAGNAQSHLHDRVKTQLQGEASGLVTARGISTEPGLRLGDIVHVKEPKFSLTGDLVDGVKEESFGSYYITSITHVCDEIGNYNNEFHGVPDSVEVPPYTNVLTPPVAETQSAVVTDNNDPKGLGRVKVRFLWEGESPWIRMLQAHGGNGKGFYFIPEIGEEVLVAFEGGNAEKPYVAGTMYNGSQLSGYATADNNLKVIHTRSGHIIKLDDSRGKESITITDTNKNSIFIDTAANNIAVTANANMTLSAGEDMVLQAKNIKIQAAEDMRVNVGKDKTENIGNDLRITAGNIEEMAVDEIRTTADNIREQTIGDFQIDSKKSIVQNAKKELFNQSDSEVGNS
ncbi:type VI secretion system Vgr family protein [Sinomicrobium sp.]